MTVPGDLDASFSGDGKQTTDFGGSDAATAVAVQADGKIVVAGSSGGNFALARYGADGTPDPSFSGDGLVTTDLGGTDAGQGVAIQADGKIVVAGSSGGNFALARYNAGWRARHVVQRRWHADDRLRRGRRRHRGGDPGRRPDRGRGSSGGISRWLATTLRARSTRRSAAMASRPPTSVGSTPATTWRSRPTARSSSWARTPFGGGAANFAVARYSAGGALDRRRGRPPTSAAASPPTTAAKASRSRPTAASSSWATAQSRRSSAATTRATFSSPATTTSGALDTSFSDDGRLATSFGADTFGYGVALESNGRIVAFGKAAGAFALARYNTDGTLDATFSDDGKQTTDAALAGADEVGVDGVAAGRRQAGGRRDRGPADRLRARALPRRRAGSQPAGSEHTGNADQRRSVRADERDGAVVQVHGDARGLDVRMQARRAGRGDGHVHELRVAEGVRRAHRRPVHVLGSRDTLRDHRPDPGDAAVHRRYGGAWRDLRRRSAPLYEQSGARLEFHSTEPDSTFLCQSRHAARFRPTTSGRAYRRRSTPARPGCHVLRLHLRRRTRRGTRRGSGPPGIGRSTRARRLRRS